jgi:hypothetical protein
VIRRFKQDAPTRFAKGDVRDYPHQTWLQIAKSARVPLDKLTEPVPELNNLRSPTQH